MAEASIGTEIIPHKIKIRKNLVFITSNTKDVFKLLTNLFATDTITASDIQEIILLKTDLEKHMALYMKIYRQGEEAFQKLCAALQQTCNECIISKLENTRSLLQSEDQERNASSENIPDSMIMKEYQRQNIFKHFSDIAESTKSLVNILIHLVQADVLTLEEYQKILSWKTDKTKNSAFYITMINKRPNPHAKLIKVLRETNNGVIADKLEKEPEQGENFDDEIRNIRMVVSRMQIDEVNFLVSYVPDNIWFGNRQPLPKDKFIGRDDILRQLQKSLKSQEDEAKNNKHSKFTALCGLPGVGKSETVRQYIRSYHNEDNIIWINAENIGTIRDSFRELARDHLHIDILDANGQEKDSKLLVREVYENLSDRRCIFVFDNAENKEEFRHENSIDRFLPILQPSHRRPFVIATSQNNHWPSPTESWEIIKIDVFTKPESVIFIKKRLQIEIADHEMHPEAKHDVEKLSLAMKGHPLALRQTVEYILLMNLDQENAGSSYDIPEFLKDFEEKEKVILDHNPFARSAGDDNPHLITIFATWKLSVEGILKTEDSGERAIEILNIMAYYDSYGIRSKLFHPYIRNPRKLGMILGILQRYSLITVSDGIVDIHGLFQQVARLDLKEQKKDEEILEISMKLLNHLMPRDITSYIKGEEIAIPHAQVAWEHAINYPNLVCKYHDDLGLVIMENVRNGCHSRATKFSDGAILHMGREFGTTNDEVMKMRTVNLLSSFRMGKDVSLQMATIMDVAKEKVGQSYKPKNNLEAITSDYLRNLSGNESILQLRENLTNFLGKATEAVFEEKHEDEADNMFAAAGFQMVQAALMEQSGQHEQALKILQTVEKGMKKSLGNNHQLVVYVRKTIAGVLSSLGRSGEALQLLEEIRSSSEKSNESNQSANDIARIATKYIESRPNDDAILFSQIESNILSATGDHEGALNALGYREDQSHTASSSSTHAVSKTKINISEDTLQTQVLIAKNLISQGKYPEALQIAEESYILSLEKFGSTNNTTVCLLSVLIWALDRLERFDDAIDKAQILFETLSNAFGDDNEMTMSILVMIPELIEKRDRHMEK